MSKTKLFYSPNSPFARKCRVVILEKGLKDIELIDATPSENPPELLAINSLATVPALVTSQGMHVSESAVISEYLDRLPSSASALIPRDNEAWLCVTALAALADGIMTAAVACVMEGRRPEDKRHAPWVERKENAVKRSIEKIAKVGLDASLPPNMGSINTAIALDYVSFRLPHLAWEKAYPELAKWRDAITSRPSFAQTKPA